MIFSSHHELQEMRGRAYLSPNVFDTAPHPPPGVPFARKGSGVSHALTELFPQEL
jgi:hypothetical protein